MTKNVFPRSLRRTLAAVALIAAVLFPAGPVTSPAAATDATDGSHSKITQEVADRTPLSGGGWQVTIEATLDSNAICHVLLFQCVVQPELAPANMTLVEIQCPLAWIEIDLILPIIGTVMSVCTRFDSHRAGLDQKFRFIYNTPVTAGTVTETVKFFRFPEEFFFIRAQDTISINLAAPADIVESCPDTATIGNPISCTVTVNAVSVVPAASVTRIVPMEFTSASLVPDANPSDWSCAGVTCTYTAGGGNLPIGRYTFTAAANVVGPSGPVEDCSSVLNGSTTVSSNCAAVQIYDANVDTFMEVVKSSSVREVDSGAPLTFKITVTNTGPNTANAVRVFETPSALLEGATIKFVSGGGTWACTDGTTLQCTAPSLGVGETATFEVAGAVSAAATPGSPILNEVTVEYPNDPFGPEFPVRDGTLVFVAGATAQAATPVSATPNFTG